MVSALIPCSTATGWTAAQMPNDPRASVRVMTSVLKVLQFSSPTLPAFEGEYRWPPADGRVPEVAGHESAPGHRALYLRIAARSRSFTGVRTFRH